MDLRQNLGGTNQISDFKKMGVAVTRLSDGLSKVHVANYQSQLGERDLNI